MTELSGPSRELRNCLLIFMGSLTHNPVVVHDESKFRCNNTLRILL